MLRKFSKRWTRLNEILTLLEFDSGYNFDCFRMISFRGIYYEKNVSKNPKGSQHKNTLNIKKRFALC